ncbi:MAG: hypothetical protein WBG02_05510 [Candidatus Acidiferrum sp.]
MHPRLAPIYFALAGLFLLPSPSTAFDSPLSPEAVRDAYFLGQHNDENTAAAFAPYFRVLPAPDAGPYIAEVEIYTPYLQVLEASRRRSMNYSAQQAELDYRHHHDKLYVRVRIDFTDTYGAFELYRSAKGDQEQSGADQPLPDFYRDFRVGLSQRSSPDREDHWIEPLRIILQATDTFNSGHFAFIPEDLGPFSYLGAGYGYSSSSGYFTPTGWLVWLEYDAQDVASDDASVEVITTDGQDVVVPFDLSRLR